MSTQNQKVAIVTGASGGIGTAVSERLARDGFTVVVNYSGNTATAEALVRKIEGAGGRAISAQANVADAAVLSIGGGVARGIEADATRNAMTRGDYAAKLVRDFALRAAEDDMFHVNAVAHGSELPILAGLAYILEQGGERA